jgi:hypothetical protein
MGIYVGFQSLSILKYLEPLTGDLFMTWFTDCIFNEDHFLALGGDNKFITDDWEINWDDKSILSSDSHTKETKLQVQKILELQQTCQMRLLIIKVSQSLWILLLTHLAEWRYQ